MSRTLKLFRPVGVREQFPVASKTKVHESHALAALFPHRAYMQVARTLQVLPAAVQATIWLVHKRRVAAGLVPGYERIG